MCRQKKSLQFSFAIGTDNSITYAFKEVRTRLRNAQKDLYWLYSSKNKVFNTML